MKSELIKFNKEKSIEKILEFKRNIVISFVDTVLAIGEELTFAKKSLQHGEWLPYLRATKTVQRMAYYYMEIYKEMSKRNLQHVANLKDKEKAEGISFRGIMKHLEIGMYKNKEEVETPSLPEGKFNVIYADPPWQYEFSETENRKIEQHYSTMKLEEICNLTDKNGKKIQEIIFDNAVLFLWVTAPKLEQGIEVIKSWNFQYRTCAIWDKELIGMGYWFRGEHELLLVAKKGNFPPPKEENRISSMIRAKRTIHSEKPKIVYEMIEKMLPNMKYLDCFSRIKEEEKRENWTYWGYIKK